MPPGKFELLAIQAEGSRDDRGRIVGSRGITIACADNAQALWIGAELPDAVATELTAAFDRAPRTIPTEAPPALALCERILGDTSLERTAGPIYLIPPDTQFASALDIERSDASRGDALRQANPGNWHPVEWTELLDGKLGPWAIATAGDRVASICHTPGPVTPRAAECGVWTDPELRGRGHAAAVTAAWAELVRDSSLYLFYSTSAENRSSQAVAHRLQLELLGWTWRLAPPPDDDLRLHPLCSLRGR
jgi:RimJ/RimL family protein N-acetyltransferase